MRRIACIVKPATSRTPITTSPGFRPKGAAGRIIQICEAIRHDPAATCLQRARLQAPGKRPCGRCTKRPLSKRGQQVSAFGARTAHGDYRPVTAPIRFRHAAGILAAVTVLSLPGALAAQSPSRHELSRVSPSGNYLAARHASSERDAIAASAYYRAALRADPRNSELLDRAFVSVLAEGDIEEAVRL